MTLAPLLDASPIIQFHAAFAFAAIGLGAVQLLAPKGTLPHRTIGWAWALLMILVAGTSLFIHTIRMWGPWSPIHLLSLFTLAVVPLVVHNPDTPPDVPLNSTWLLKTVRLLGSSPEVPASSRVPAAVPFVAHNPNWPLASLPSNRTTPLKTVRLLGESPETFAPLIGVNSKVPLAVPFVGDSAHEVRLLRDAEQRARARWQGAIEGVWNGVQQCAAESKILIG